MNEIIEIGAQMRQAQKNYFSTRMKRWLIKSKELEQQFDQLIEKYQKSHTP